MAGLVRLLMSRQQVHVWMRPDFNDVIGEVNETCISNSPCLGLGFFNYSGKKDCCYIHNFVCIQMETNTGIGIQMETFVPLC